VGGFGDDLLTGGEGADTLFGNQDADTLFGNFADDFMHGGQGNDYLHGGQGNDTLNCWVGNDDLIGGLGDDRFVFAPLFGDDKLFGFTAGGVEDAIVFTGGTFANYAEVQAAMTQVGSDTVITRGGDTITLVGVQSSTLTQDDFIFG